jgi:hypothetical protein
MNGHVTKPVDYATLMRAIAEATSRPQEQEGQDWAEVVPASIEQCAPLGFDREVLDETLMFLSRDEIAGHFLSLRDRNEKMLWLLDQPDDEALLKDTAHGLASTVGMFGFQALLVALRQLERALIDGSPAPDWPKDQVRSEIRAALSILAELAPETRMQLA